MKRIILLGGLLLWLKPSLAQETGPIATERPTQSIGSLVLPTNSFQFEQGFTYASDTLVLDGFFRLAISNLGEIRLLTFYDSPEMTVGAKVKLLKMKNYRPGLAIKADLTAGRLTDVRLVVMQKISDRWLTTVNAGYTSFTGRYYVVAALFYTFGRGLSVYGEGFLEGDYVQLNSGIMWAFNSETQIDLNVGLLDLNTAYINFGFARRFKYRKQE